LRLKWGENQWGAPLPAERFAARHPVPTVGAPQALPDRIVYENAGICDKIHESAENFSQHPPPLKSATADQQFQGGLSSWRRPTSSKRSCVQVRGGKAGKGIDESLCAPIAGPTPDSRILWSERGKTRGNPPSLSQPPLRVAQTRGFCKGKKQTLRSFILAN